MRFDGCKLTMTLEPQFPMVHFQEEKTEIDTLSAQEIPTLRATEVKPKLDRFIVRQIKKREGLDFETNVKEKYPDYFSDEEHFSLKYKMEICETEKINAEKQVVEQKRDEIFFCKGKSSHVVFLSPKVTIICFHAKLRKEIESAIEDFFIVTNFGGKQRKGFGSFLPKETNFNQNLNEDEKKEIAKKLKEETGADFCYEMSFLPLERVKLYRKMFRNMNTFYKAMKSGINIKKDFASPYIYVYMQKKGIDNEKYVRALLGTAEQISYTYPKKLDIEIKKTGTKKQSDGQEIKLERVPSPIYFKVIKNTVFITAYPVLEEIYETQYEFSVKEGENKGKIRIPAKDEFDIGDFLKEYVQYYNAKFKGCDVKVGEICD